jgi:4-hydroxy-3-methylbut-2-en-1-yl diphosphate synthase IspG/GcpE
MIMEDIIKVFGCRTGYWKYIPCPYCGKASAKPTVSGMRHGEGLINPSVTEEI